MKKMVLVILLLALAAAGYFYWEKTKKGVEIMPEASMKSETGGFLEKKGAALYKERYFRNQIAAYEMVLKAAPQSQQTKQKLADLHYEIATLALENGDDEKAKKELEAALLLVPDHAEAKKTLLHME